jgi:phosphoribosylglycinamide formyltransferase-1
MMPPPRFAFVSSSGGSMMDQALRHPLVRDLTHGLVCDRACSAVERARGHGLPVDVMSESDPGAFSRRLLDYLSHSRIDYVFSFYTQFFSPELREVYRDRLLNFHPSLLPAFKGMDGFGDGWRSGVTVLGSTVELIDEVMDEGKVVMQTCFPRDPALSVERVRHRLFEQQCRSLLQVTKWIVDGRLRVDGPRVAVEGARFDTPEFSPGLDWDEAARWTIPFPGAEALAPFSLPIDSAGGPFGR